jgi:hypothetical protein
LGNGKYDFNSEIVNNLFNNLSKSYQNTLLSLYSEKNGVKKYDLLDDALIRILEKNTGVESGFF